MNTKDIRTSADPDLAGSFAAMERASRAAQDLAIKTNTGIVVAVDDAGVNICVGVSSGATVNQSKCIERCATLWITDDERVGPAICPVR